MTRRGFTLIEMVAALVILGFLAAVAGMGLVQLTQGYVSTRQNARVVEKGQAAMARLAKDFALIERVSTGLANRITYTLTSGASHTVEQSGANLLYDGVVLTDAVSSFTLGYQSSLSAAAASSYSSATNLINVRYVLLAGQDMPQSFDQRFYLRKRNRLD